MHLLHNTEVLLNGFTFIAATSNVVHAGGRPIFVDVNDKYVMDLEDF